MKLLYVGRSSCSADTLARLFLLDNELCFLDRPSVTFDRWGTMGHASPLRLLLSGQLPVDISGHEPQSGPRS